MSAAECRAAASKLRELAQRATPGPWRLGSDRWAALVADRKHPDRMVGGGWEWDDAYGGCLVAESLMRPDREYFAAMNPLVGAALADLLDDVAEHAESNDEHDGFPPALTIARLINGSGALLDCDAIYMLPGWRESRGATTEHAVSVACGMRIYTEADQ